jgi:quinol monooxygenase YgiN
MALALFVNFTVKPGDEEKAKELMRKMEEHTRREPGCRQYIGHQSADDPRRFAFYELYEDKAALDAHAASPHYQEYVKNGLRALMDTRMFAMFNTLD